MAHEAEGTVLIAGALGLVGRAALEHFEAQEGWDIVAMARRAPDFPTGARFLSAQAVVAHSRATAFRRVR